MEAYKNIGIFTRDDSTPTTMEYGYYYKAEMKVPFSGEPRTVRVWLPDDYDFDDTKKTFPVIYFADGQNLVNRYLTLYGDWRLDKTAHAVYSEKHLSFIAVGVDSPRVNHKREAELCPPFTPDNPTCKNRTLPPVGDKFVNFIADDLKRLIDKLFHTRSEKDFTAIGGSSMGGIMAFYGGATRSDVFGFSLAFSPAFFLYRARTWKDFLIGLDLTPSKGVKYFLYVGGVGFEKDFTALTLSTHKFMLKRGFNEQNVALIYDSLGVHHEDSWYKYSKDALIFWLDNDK